MTIQPPSLHATEDSFSLSLVNALRCVSIILFAAFPSPSEAQAEARPFCLHTEPFAPDGVIVRMGTEYYRTCRNRSTDLPWRRFLLKMDPALVPNLFSDFPPTSLTIAENIESLDRQASSLRMKEKSGTVTMGGVDYVVYESPPAEKTGLPNLITWVYDAKGESIIPSHWVECVGAAFIYEGDTMSCFLRVRKGDVTGMLHFIGSIERGFGFMDHFPEFAQDIVRVLDVANVTDEMDKYTTFLDVIE